MQQIVPRSRACPQCGGCRTIAPLIAFPDLGADPLLVKLRGTVFDRRSVLSCKARGCGGRPLAAWLVTGPTLNERITPRRVALLGPEARE